MTSQLFHAALYGLSGISYISNWGAQSSVIRTISGGLQFFTVTSLVDRAAQAFFLKNKEMRNQRLPLGKAIVDPVIETVTFSGVLHSTRAALAPLRWGAAYSLGASATRAFSGRVTEKQNKEGFTVDTKTGIAWACVRELALFTLPVAVSVPVCIACDSGLYGLSSVSPKEGSKPSVLYSSEWKYKVLSSAFFRAATNVASFKSGVLGSLLGHYFFNIFERYRVEEPS